MAFTDTKVYLLNTPLENDYQHTLVFKTAYEQFTYFSNKAVWTASDFSYQRKDNKIRVNAKFDDIVKCNYVMYQNPSYSQKWFYAFVTKVEYVDDGRSDVYIETDVLQTWMFDYEVGESFIEREHVDDDTTGKHTIPEGLETGEFVCNGVKMDENLIEQVYVINHTTTGILQLVKASTNLGGIPVAGMVRVCETVQQVETIIKQASDDGAIDSIYAVYTAPKLLFSPLAEGELFYEGKSKPTEYFIMVARPSTLNGYTPRNNKLYCYPYNYLMGSNNAGVTNVYRYENFSDVMNPEFKVTGIPTIGCSIKCVPVHYKGNGESTGFEDEGIMCGKFPTLSWSADLYTNWMTQNGTNIAVDTLAGVGQIALGIGAMAMPGFGPIGGASLIMGGATSIGRTIGQVDQMSHVPPSARGNINGGDINFANGKNTFFFYKMSVKEEYAKVIDRYFDMYGYKVVSLKTPNKWHRSKYWFTKTIDVNIKGAIPKDDMNKIRSAYNNGITFWRNPANFRDYSGTNNIVTE